MRLHRFNPRLKLCQRGTSSHHMLICFALLSLRKTWWSVIHFHSSNSVNNALSLGWISNCKFSGTQRTFHAWRILRLASFAHSSCISPLAPQSISMHFHHSVRVSPTTSPVNAFLTCFLSAASVYFTYLNRFVMSRITGILNACRVTLELVITIGDWSGNKTIS